MPITPQENENQDDFISRCIRKEMDAGKPQDQAVAICISIAEEEFSATASVSDATWSGDAPVAINLESYNDYPDAAVNAAKRALKWAEENGWGSCGEATGKRRANQLANREPITEDTIARMASFARHKQNSETPYGEGCGKLMWDAWGGTAGIEWASRKLKQIRSKKENMRGQKPKRSIIFEEDFNAEDIIKWKDMGFKIYVRSQRKIKKADKKVWNKLKSVGLSEDNLLFGEIEQLNNKYNFHLIFNNNDPYDNLFTFSGKPLSNKKIIHQEQVFSMQDAIEKEKIFRKRFAEKFRTIEVVYTYEEIPDVEPAQSGSREFCRKRLAEKREYTLSEIQNLSNGHLVEMFANYPGLEPDVFLYRGGFYREPGKDGITTPYCRHQWKANVRFV